MEIKKGIGVSNGVVTSTAIVLDSEDLVIPRRTVPADALSAEADRLDHAIRIHRPVLDLIDRWVMPDVRTGDPTLRNAHIAKP